MSEAVKELTDANFDQSIATGTVLIDFWAPWCMPCQMQTPILEEVAAAVGEKAIIAKVNVDESSAVSGKFGIMSIPTLILFKDGQEVQRFVSLQQAQTLLDAIESHT